MNKYYNKNNVVEAIQFTLDSIGEIGQYINRFEIAFNIDGRTPFLLFPENVSKQRVREYDWVVFGDKLEVLDEEDFNRNYGKLK